MIYYFLKNDLNLYTILLLKDDYNNLDGENITNMKIKCFIVILTILLHIKLTHVNYGITSRHAVNIEMLNNTIFNIEKIL